MPTILQASDPHFGTEVEEVTAALHRLYRRIDPDLLILSGDITQRATRRQFASARAFVDGLQPRSLLALPGNHDMPLVNVVLRLLDPYRRYQEAFGTDLEPVFETESLLVIGVNTTVPHWHKDGAISASRIADVANRLADARAGQLRIVVSHHPAAVLRAGDRRDRLHGGEQALQAWTAAGVDLVLGGHIHLTSAFPILAEQASVSDTALFVQAGTAVSRRIREQRPNAVSVVRYDRNHGRRHGQVEFWEYSVDIDEFQCASTHRLGLAGGPTP